MEETNKDKSNWCECPCCRGYKYGTWGHGHYFARWLLGLIILGIVFSLGVKIGEFRGYYGGDFGLYEFGHHRMMYPSFSKKWPYPIPYQPEPASSSTQK